MGFWHIHMGHYGGGEVADSSSTERGCKVIHQRQGGDRVTVSRLGGDSVTVERQGGDRVTREGC